MLVTLGVIKIKLIDNRPQDLLRYRVPYLLFHRLYMELFSQGDKVICLKKAKTNKEHDACVQKAKSRGVTGNRTPDLSHAKGILYH